MKHPLFALALSGALLCAAVPTLALYSPAVQAQQQLAKERADEAEQRRKQAMSEPEGIAVPKRSKLASLASSEQLEKDAVLQYRKLLQQAQSQRALAPEDYPQRQRLQEIASRLIPYTHRFSDRSDAWRWEVNLIGSQQVNAFVMPGGKIVFFTGILDKLKLTDDEVAMIMGHEMAHALLEHSRQRAGQQKLAQGITIGASVFSQILGYGDLGGVIASQGSKLTLLKFNRGDETEADLIGMDIAARAGYDPRAAVSLWQKMGAASKGEPPQFLSTHPSHSTRIDTLREAQPKVMPLYERARRASADAPRTDWGATGNPATK